MMPHTAMTVLTFFAVAAAGLCLGSFATALLWRLPRDISIWSRARSQCPSCGAGLRFFDLFPVFSYLALRGRCRYCKTRISGRYPVVELATLGLVVAFYAAAGLQPVLVPLLLLAPVLIVIIAIDLEAKIIFDGLNLTVLLTGVLAAATAVVYMPPAEIATTAAGGMMLYGAGSYAVRWLAGMVLKREAMGLGDIKFFAAAGVWLGASVETLALFLIVAGGSGVVLSYGWQHVRGEKDFPFAPSLVLALAVMLVMTRTPWMPV